MAAVAHEAPMTMPGPDFDEILWQAWEAMELPEPLRAEIVEDFIEVWPTGRFRPAKLGNRLREELSRYLDRRSSPYVDMNVINIIHGRKVWVPDAVVVPEDNDEFVTEDGLGLDARCVALVVEVVSPEHDGRQRDRVRKHRAYARAGIPVYVIIDDHDNDGTVTVLTLPCPDEAYYAESHRVPYGKDVTIPEGPAKGFTIGESITGPSRTDG